MSLPPTPSQLPPATGALLYLDSSDFSDLSKSESDLSPDDSLLARRLREAARSGSIICPLSPIHLLEAVHAQAAYRAVAIQRANLMQELCGPYHLRYATEVGRIEAESFFRGDGPSSIDVRDLLSNTDEWFGVTVTPTDRRKSFRTDLLKAVTDSRLPGPTRRRLQTSLKYDPPRSKELWRELWSTSLTPQTLEFPMNLLSPSMVFEWFLGSISNSALNQRILAIMRDPPTLIGRLLDLDHGRREQAYNMLRGLGARMLSNFNQKMVDVAQKSSEYITLGGDPRQIEEALRAAANEALTPRALCSMFDERIKSISDIELETFLKRSPACALFVNVAKSYCLDLMRAKKPPRAKSPQQVSQATSVI